MQSHLALGLSSLIHILSHILPSIPPFAHLTSSIALAVSRKILNVYTLTFETTPGHVVLFLSLILLSSMIPVSMVHVIYMAT